MEMMQVIQWAVFYLIVLGFVGFGLWKFYEYLKGRKKDDDLLKDLENLKIAKPSNPPSSFERPKKFYSLEDMKGGKIWHDN